MKGIATLLAGALALAACSSEESGVENMIREGMAARGAVGQVDMTRRDADHYTGFATIRPEGGAERRTNCTAERLSDNRSAFSWRCVPANDEPMQAEVEASIRSSYASRGQVRQVDMSAQGEDRMQGFAVVADAYGTETRLDCSATRNTNGSFDWNCDRAGSGGGAAAPAPDGGK